MTDDTLHPALAEARKARTMEPAAALEYLGPSRLYALCEPANDPTLYMHALTEAGYVVHADGIPFDPCPHCGWSPST